jgi:hypothetical protein
MIGHGRVSPLSRFKARPRWRVGANETLAIAQTIPPAPRERNLPNAALAAQASKSK